MARVSVGMLLGGTFRLIRAHLPLFGLIASLWLGISLLLMAVARAAPADTPAFGRMMLMVVATVLVQLVAWNAVFRAALDPGLRGLMMVRLGLDELRLLGLALAFVLIAIIAMVLVIVAFLVLGFIGKMFAAGTATAVVALILYLGVIGGAVFVLVRLSLAGPLTLVHRRIAIEQSWALTSGRFWRLLAANLVLFLLLAALGLLYLRYQLGPVWYDLWHPTVEGARDRIAAWQAAQAQMPIGPSAVVLLVAGCVYNAFTVMLQAGLAGVATRLLLDRQVSASAGGGPWEIVA